jgi:two-component system, NarL family, nitrate/nitrite response regulator NarL
MRRRVVATVLVGPNTLQREGLARILCMPKFRVVASGTDWRDLNIAALDQYQSRLLVMDSFEASPAALANVRLFKERSPHGRVAILGRGCEMPDIVTVFQSGANVYFSEFATTDEFMKAIELVMLGQTILPLELLSRALDMDPAADSTEAAFPDVGAATGAAGFGRNSVRLSAREREIVDWITRGASNKMIAREIDISEATVKVHVKTILRKIGVSNRTQAAIWAMSNKSQAPDLGSPARLIPAARTFASLRQNGALRPSSSRGTEGLTNALRLVHAGDVCGDAANSNRGQ